MALGGGTFLTQNKVLPGAYINFVSTAKASATLSDRGYATMPLTLDWGMDDEIFTVTVGDFLKHSRKIFGYDYAAPELKPLRDLFLNVQTLHAYRLNSGGEKAANTFCTAVHSGIRGNDLKITVQPSPDMPQNFFEVNTLLGTDMVDSQTVQNMMELKPNDYVTWKLGATLAETSATPLTGGTNKAVTGGSHQAYLAKIESYSFNVMGVAVDEEETKKLYVAFTQRMRNEVGAKFQTVVHNFAADDESIINVKNSVTDADAKTPADIVYWVTGLQANCPINKSCLNVKYNGEYTVDTDLTQAELIDAIRGGEFALHKVGSDVRVLEDINSLTTVTDTKGDLFKDNQTVRVCDQIANDIAVLFNMKYLGLIPNDAAGRVSLWADIVKHHEQLQDIRAIEGFADSDITVEQGDSKKSVVVTDKITVVNTMAQLYMTVTVQ